MFRDYLDGKITVPSPARHAEYVARAIPMLPPETVVLRMTCDTPKERRGAPFVGAAEGGSLPRRFCG